MNIKNDEIQELAKAGFSKREIAVYLSSTILQQESILSILEDEKSNYSIAYEKGQLEMKKDNAEKLDLLTETEKGVDAVKQRNIIKWRNDINNIRKDLFGV